MNRLALSVVFLLLLPLATSAESPRDFAFWGAGDLEELTASLPDRVNEQSFALERLGDFEQHYALMIYREGNGPAEMHARETDFYVVREGMGTLVTGGTINEAVEVEPGEIRGSSIAAGREMKLKAGDVVNIPNGTPHQVRLAEGESITYLIIKIKSQ